MNEQINSVIPMFARVNVTSSITTHHPRTSATTSATSFVSLLQVVFLGREGTPGIQGHTHTQPVVMKNFTNIINKTPAGNTRLFG